MSIGLAESSDNGKTWLKGGQILKSGIQRTRGFSAYQGVRGIGEPSAVLDPLGRYIYLYYTCFSGQPFGSAQICMARSDLSKGPLAGTWEKFYHGSFGEPGLDGKESPALDSYPRERLSSKYPHVIYSQALRKYILTFNVERYTENEEGMPPTKSGIYLALSDDGINWAKPAKLVNAYSQRILGLSISIEATIILDGEDGLAGWLVYAYTPKYTNGALPGTPLYMVGRRIEFLKPE